ncbi:MAG: MoaD/ThiS family protein [Planctomyces sp.]|nr:MoaD/ThiS family protein [Planctomyces sp.]
MTVRVLLFAKARDLAGASELALDLPEGATVQDLRRALEAAAPDLAPLSPRLHIAVNSRYAADGDVIPPGAELACFPPVSGG